MGTVVLSISNGALGYRELGSPDASGLPIVVLHGISSGSGSWIPMSKQLTDCRILAWDAPGYGFSHDLSVREPHASDYADRLESWLAALKVSRCIVVGHSLGALMATAYVNRYPERVAGLVLADPAQGYMHDTFAKRQQVYHSRWPELERLGPIAYARKRAPRLLRSNTPIQCLRRVEEQIRNLHLEGFRRANWMLANDAIVEYLPMPAGLAGLVLCGAEDVITPPAQVQTLAAELEWPYVELAGAGHASYIDNPEAFAAALKQFSHRVVTQPLIA